MYKRQHSDSVVYELTGYEIPTVPKFITESGDSIANTFSIDWATFSGAESYQLFMNDELVYEGDMTSYEAVKLADGTHVFTINAVLDVGYIISGNEIEIHVDFIPPSPIFNQLSSEKVHTVVLGESIPLSWSEIPDHGWYSVIVQDADGVVTEVFNGTENTTTLTDLSLCLLYTSPSPRD